MKKKIKECYEFLCVAPETWTEEDINKHVIDMSLSFPRKTIMWCYQHEELFNNPLMNTKIIDTNQYTDKCIRYKISQETSSWIPYEWGTKEIQRYLQRIMNNSLNVRSCIWCYENEDLYKGY